MVRRTRDELLQERLDKSNQACDDLSESWQTTLGDLAEAKQEIASRDAAIAELQKQLEARQRDLDWAYEQTDLFMAAATANARLLTNKSKESEHLRFCEGRALPREM